MFQRTTLDAGEYRRIELLVQHLVIGQDQTAARAAQRLVRGRCHDMGMFERVWMRPTRHKTGEMGHVHHQLRIDRVRDLAEPGKVYLARISRAAGNDQLGMIFARSEEHTSELQSLMRISYAVFCLKKKNK